MSTAATPAVAGTGRRLQGILRDVLDRRPPGMRQRLAEALGKNRSFISQIANPNYQTPIPAQHIDRIIRDLPLLAAGARSIPCRLSTGASATAAGAWGS